jgi:hypothetical protein
MTERRRSPRLPAGADDAAALPVQHAIQILDISLSGVLLHATTRIDVGARVNLRLNLAGAPLAVDAEIRRVTAAKVAGGVSAYRIGAAFVSLTPKQRGLLERFERQ